MIDDVRPSLFQHGVASGDPTPRRVVIWTRVTAPPPHAPAAAFWRVLEADSGRPVANGQTRVRAEADDTIRVDVGGLRPDTRYVYEFEVDGETSPQGRTRTLPEGDVASIRFGQVSGARDDAGRFDAYARLAQRDDLQFLLHLGGWIDADECVTLDDYRRCYAEYRSDPDVQAVSAAHPIVSTVDDHELADGAWRDGASEHRPERDGPWAERRAAAFRAREEWLPVRRSVMTEPERVFRSMQIGDLAELFLIDTRTRRDEPVASPAANKPGRTALGPEQKAWLFDGLGSSRARWRLIGHPSVMAGTSNDRLPTSMREALALVKPIDPNGTGPGHDQWEGYPQERRELLDLISKLDVANVVVLSGDARVAPATELAARSDEPPVAVELGNASPNGYSIVELDRETLRFEWWNVGSLETRVPDQAPAAAISVRHGTPRLIVEGGPASGAMDLSTAAEAKAEQPSWASKPAKPPKQPKAAKPAKVPKSAKPAPAAELAKRPKPAKPAKSAKPAEASKAAKPAKPAKPVKPAKPKPSQATRPRDRKAP